ncbi:HNH endonuclease signature motif containing protein [soil metagenome]
MDEGTTGTVTATRAPLTAANPGVGPMGRLVTRERQEAVAAERLGRICGQLNAGYAELVDTVTEIANDELWVGEGIRSVEQYLVWKTGLDRRHVVELLQVAASRSSHPEVFATFESGRLTLDQTALAVKVRPCDDHDFAHLATVMTLSQLRTAVNKSNAQPEIPGEPVVDDTDDTDDSDSDEVTEMPDPSPADAVPDWVEQFGHDSPAHGGVGPEFVSLTPTDDGRWRLSGMLAADHGAVLDAALAELLDRLRTSRGPSATRVDALLAMAEQSLETTAAPRRDRFRINLFLDPTVSPYATWIDGFAVPDAIAALLTCNGTVSPVFTDGAHPVSVGRSTRVISDRLRRLIIARDGGKCRNPMCGSTHDLEVHHIIHWILHGPTDTYNLVTLCRSCHRAHHLGRVHLEGDADQPDGLTFTNDRGQPVSGATAVVPPSGPPPEPPQRYRHPLGERYQHSSLHFNRLPRSPRRHRNC